MDHSHADTDKHVRLYLTVFAALAVGTVVTVAANQLHVEHALAIGIALGIATVKASLVAAVFMHLKWERSAWIWSTLALCAVFFVVLLFIPVLETSEHPPNVVVGTWDVLPEAHTEHAGHHE
ncbi:MAG: cytochrome C oxidase subunit IV family protein [Planctomycetes bacterium]|nr:cytochrome C oxidase subunit IV family protein [Planctomycetota bacterium]MBI3833310.1 cytochrome C oxidase subunit IV family protein [Planctomycetota bacterium]